LAGVGSLFTARLELVSVSSDLVEAVLTSNRDRAEACIGAILPALWPGRALVERAFYASLEHILQNPDERLWGDRVMITRRAPSTPRGALRQRHTRMARSPAWWSVFEGCGVGAVGATEGTGATMGATP